MAERERDPEDEERAAARLVVERVRPPAAETSLPNLIALAAILLVLVIVKPWAIGAPGPTPAPVFAADTPGPPTPVPTEDRTALGLASPICLGTGAWRVTSMETWQSQDVRVWRAISPVASATGPLDPSIPSVPIVAIRLKALGWCAPAFGDDMPTGPADVSAWSVRGDAATPLTLDQVLPSDGVTPIAALYLPVIPAPNPIPRDWTNERVVFRYHDAGSGKDAWFAADILIMTPSPEPSR